MGQKKKSDKRIKKEAYWRRLWELTETHKRALFVDVDNVSSLQITRLRHKFRELDATMIMGKNTLMKAALNHKMQEPKQDDDDFEERKDSWKPCPEVEKLVNLLRGNTGIIFSNGDLGEIKKVIDSEAREAPAKVGSIAPLDVWIQAGPTGLDPKQTAFFQNLNIQTKIVKTQIEIVSEKKIVTQGQKVESSQVALLEKLKIRPFSYKMHIKQVYEDGSVFKPEILDLTPEDILAKFKTSIRNMAAISLGSGYITKPAIPHMLVNAFKNVACVSLAADYNFKELDELKEAAASSVAVAPTGGAPAEKAAPADAKKKEEKEDSDDGLGDGLGLGFDDDY